LRDSWTLWHLRRITRLRQRAAQRLLLLQLETDHQLLRLKELEQLEQLHQHRIQETQVSRQYREHPELTVPKPEVSSPGNLLELLGPQPPLR